MKVKYQGGPMHNKYQELPTSTYSYSDRVEVTEPMPINYRDALLDKFDPLTAVRMKRGHYARSNKRLKNGAQVYIWMGWVE